MKSAQIERMLHSPEAEERRQAAALLAEQTEEGVVPLLLRALGDEDWRVRKEATAAAIAHAPSPDVLRALIDALKPGDNVGLRNAVVEAIAGFGAPAVDAVFAVVPELDADGRKLAVEALGKTSNSVALLALQPLLSDEDPNVRAAAAENIAAIGVTCLDAAVPLLEQCLDSEDQLVRLTALDGLNRLGVVLDWERLESLLAEPILERPALLAAGRSAHVEAAPLLVRALDRTRTATWQAALRALADFVRADDRSRRAAQTAVKALSSSARERLLREAALGEDLELRRAALLLVGVVGSAEAAEIAADALSDDRVAASAEQALSLLGAIAVPALIARASTGYSSDRALCIELLGRLANAEQAEPAIQAVLLSLDDASSEVVSSGLSALAEIGDERCMAVAAEWLADSRATVRSAAAIALGAIATRHPSAARKLAAELGPAGREAQVVATVICAVGPPVRGSLEADASFLCAALSDDSSHVRRAALEALSALPGALACEAVAFALTDEEREVQLAAVRALGRLRSDDGSVAGFSNLLDLIDRSEDEVLVAASIRALGAARDSRALTVLKPLVRSGRVVHAVAAVEALGSISDPRRVDALTSALSHPDPEVVKAALRVLAQEADPRVPAHVGACLDHEAWDVRRLAADLLGDIGADATSGLLRAKLSIEPEPLVKDAVQRALGEVEGVPSVRRSTPPPGGSWRPR